MQVLALALVLALAASPSLCQDGSAGGSPPPFAPPPGVPPPIPLPTIPSPSAAPPVSVTPPVAAPPTVPPPATAPPPTTPPTAAPPPAVTPASAPPAVTPTKAPPPPVVPPPPGTPAASPPPPGSSTAAAVATGGPSTTNSGGSSGPSEADVLTFAYNLECLEGNFYSCAATGQPLNSSITGNGPAPSSCTKANLTNNTMTYAIELAREETAHVQVLYDALTAAGASPVCPYVNIDTAFEAAAEFSVNATSPLNPTFNPYANDAFFLHGSFIFEDLGASAYAGAVGLLSTAAYKTTAVQIGNTESYHSAIIRTLLYSIINEVPAYNLTTLQITNAIVSGLNILSGPPQLKYSLVNTNSVGLSNVDSKALVPVATPTQVLKVVTFNATAGNGGGFFPNNLVGAVKN